jgi:hypothetical protein
MGCGAGWLVILTIVLLNSAGFTVSGRLTAVSSRTTEIKSHERSQQSFDEAIGALVQAHGRCSMEGHRRLHECDDEGASRLPLAG